MENYSNSFSGCFYQYISNTPDSIVLVISITITIDVLLFETQEFLNVADMQNIYSRERKKHSC